MGRLYNEAMDFLLSLLSEDECAKVYAFASSVYLDRVAEALKDDATGI